MALLDSLFQSQAAPEMMFDPEGRPIDPFYAAMVGKPKKKGEPAFGAGAQPIPGIGAMAGLLSGMPGIEGAKAPNVWDSAPFADRPPTNDPAAFEPKLDVPLPRPRPVGLDQSPGAPLSLAPQDYQAPDQLPPGATPTEGTAQPAAQPSAAPGGGFMDTLSGIGGKVFNPNNAATWMALGSGFSGAGSIGTGLRRASAAAGPAMFAAQQMELKQKTIADTYRALVAKGVPPADALAASQNPDIMKATAAKYFESKPRVPHVLGTDMMGNPIQGSFDPNTGKFYDAGGGLIGGGTAGGDSSGKGVTIPGTNDYILAKGVKDYNSDLPAEEYLAQFSPEVKASIQSYVNGDTMPTSNPRLKALATKVKEWAQTYGSKAGIPVSDSEFSRKRTMQNQIASSSPNSMGGILSNGKSAFGHLANLGDTFTDLGNRSGPDIPGGSHIGRTANYVGNSLLPSPETSGKLEAMRDNAGKYGAEATKFYAGTGGGVEERLSALHGIAQPGTLAAEQAAYLKTEKNLMLERLNQKEAQIRDVMGERWLQEHPVRTPDVEHHINRIDASIKKLQTGAVGSAPPAATAPAPGNYVFDPATKRLVPAQ